MNVIDLTGDGNFKYPSQFKWKKSDISKSNAGRTRDYRMHKNKGCLLYTSDAADDRAIV